MAEIDTQKRMSRSEVAEVLHEFASQLERSRDADVTIGEDEPRTGNNKVTLVVGNHSATINPTESIDFDIEIDAKDPLVGSEVKERVIFDMSWTHEQIEEDEDVEIK